MNHDEACFKSLERCIHNGLTIRLGLGGALNGSMKSSKKFTAILFFLYGFFAVVVKLPGLMPVYSPITV